MKKITIITFISFLSLMVFHTYSYSIPGDEAVKKFQDRMRNIGTMRGTISWTEPSGMLYSADFSYKAPGKIYVKFKSPHDKMIVSNGSQLWVYDSKRNICGIQELKKYGSGGIVGLINGYMAIAKENSSGYTIRLKNSEARYTDITLLVDTSFLLQRIMLRMSTGKHIAISLSNVKTGIKFEEHMFQFDVPNNAEVVKNPLNFQ